MTYAKVKGHLGAVIFAYFIVMLICAVLGGLVWPYVINSWLIFFGKPATAAFYHGWALGFIPHLLSLGVMLAVCTFIFFLFV